MRKFTGYVQTERPYSRVCFEFEVDDNAEPEAIEEEFRFALEEHIKGDYEEVKDG